MRRGERFLLPEDERREVAGSKTRVVETGLFERLESGSQVSGSHGEDTVTPKNYQLTRQFSYPFPYPFQIENTAFQRFRRQNRRHGAFYNTLVR